MDPGQTVQYHRAEEHLAVGQAEQEPLVTDLVKDPHRLHMTAESLVSVDSLEVVMEGRQTTDPLGQEACSTMEDTRRRRQWVKRGVGVESTGVETGHRTEL